MFRVTKEIFVYLMGEINPHINLKAKSIPTETKLAALLNFYATGGYQRYIFDSTINNKSKI